MSCYLKALEIESEREYGRNIHRVMKKGEKDRGGERGSMRGRWKEREREREREREQRCEQGQMEELERES